MKNLTTELKQWRLMVRRGQETIFEKLVTEETMNNLLVHIENKPSHIMIEGFGTANYREIHFKLAKENWKELDQYTNDLAKQKEIEGAVKERVRWKAYFTKNLDKYQHYSEKSGYTNLPEKHWFYSLSKLAQNTLIASKCVLLAKADGLKLT